MNADTHAAPGRSLGANLALFLVPPLLLNGVIFGLGWDRDSTPNPYLPPGWAVGAIWMLLFAAMGTASWLLLRTERSLGARAGQPVKILAFLCMVYPLYTAGLSNDRTGLAGAIVTAGFAVWVAGRGFARSRVAAALIGLVIAWLSYASVALALTLRMKHQL